MYQVSLVNFDFDLNFVIQLNKKNSTDLKKRFVKIHVSNASPNNLGETSFSESRSSFSPFPNSTETFTLRVASIMGRVLYRDDSDCRC